MPCRRYLDKERKPVLFKGKEAEYVVLAALGQRHEVAETVHVDGLPFQHLGRRGQHRHSSCSHCRLSLRVKSRRCHLARQTSTHRPLHAADVSSPRGRSKSPGSPPTPHGPAGRGGQSRGRPRFQRHLTLQTGMSLHPEFRLLTGQCLPPQRVRPPNPTPQTHPDEKGHQRKWRGKALSLHTQ